MLPFLIPALAAGKSWWKAALGAALIFPMAFLIGQCSGARHAATKAENKALTKAAPANAKAADERLTDTLAVNNRAQEARNAVAQVPDGRPSAGAVALQCQRLRNAGRPLPAACGGPQGGAQAHP